MEINIQIKDGNIIISHEKENYYADQIKDYVTSIFEIWKTIINNKLLADNYLQKYNNNNNKLLRNHDDAITTIKSYFKNYMNKLIILLKKSNLEILIGGSCGLSSVRIVYKKEKAKNVFVPNDIDLYIKNIDNTKILLIDEIIKKSLDIDQEIIIIRKSLTLSWLIFNKTTLKVFTTIQLNLLNIQSWTDVFICYHSDMVCIGYDIQDNILICLKDRWNRFIDNIDFEWEKPHFFSNFLNVDTSSSIEGAARKYYNRGFRTESIYVKNNITNPYIDNSVSGSIINTKNSTVCDYLMSGYSELTVVATSISELLTDNIAPNMLELRYVPTKYKEFYEIPQLLIKPFNDELFTDIELNDFKSNIAELIDKGITIKKNKYIKTYKQIAANLKDFGLNVPYWRFYILLNILGIKIDDYEKYFSDCTLNILYCIVTSSIEFEYSPIIKYNIDIIKTKISKRRGHIKKTLDNYVIKDINNLIIEYCSIK